MNFHGQYTATEEIADRVWPETPVLWIENDCVVTASRSVH